jgi:hypothetical protein
MPALAALLADSARSAQFFRHCAHIT